MSEFGKAVQLGDEISSFNRDQKEKEVADSASRMNLPYIDLRQIKVNPDLLRMLEPETAKKAFLVPFYRNGPKLRIAIAHPTNPQTHELVKQLQKDGFTLNINLTSEESVIEAFSFYDSEFYKPKQKLQTETGAIKTYEKELADLSELESKVQELSSAEALNLINLGAIKTGASDMHFEPEELEVRVRFRIDGILHRVFSISRKIFENIANQIKFLSKMRLNVSDIPQDGRYSFEVNARKVDVRVSALPTEFGETFVQRLLDSGKGFSSFAEMGFSGFYLKKIEKLSRISQGMILVTGPTGSGKTTTLYALLNQFSNKENKVITLEDPIEYHIQGISQSPVNEAKGYTFASGLRSILRQDPDTVLIGEIRDLDTANIASQAALTGHTVLSTLHTNSAIETISRLINIGLQAFMIAPAIHTIIAQRLVRRVCPHCSQKTPITKSQSDEIAKILPNIKKVHPELQFDIPETLPSAVGCEKCSHTGYKGRIVICEMFSLDFELKDLILKKESSIKLIEAARRKGMITMREDGLIKVIQGETTLDEVFRVTNIDT
jgi:type IV pilus assembly protein PilB